jgi:hypothetical protein
MKKIPTTQGNNRGLEVGDIALVMLGDKRVGTIIADRGHSFLGEGSVKLHEMLGRQPKVGG